MAQPEPVQQQPPPPTNEFDPEEAMMYASEPNSPNWQSNSNSEQDKKLYVLVPAPSNNHLVQHEAVQSDQIQPNNSTHFQYQTNFHTEQSLEGSNPVTPPNVLFGPLLPGGIPSRYLSSHTQINHIQATPKPDLFYKPGSSHLSSTHWPFSQKSFAATTTKAPKPRIRSQMRSLFNFPTSKERI